MDYSFHYLLLASQGLFQKKIMSELSECGLTAGQPKILDYLGLHDGSVQKDIALACQIEPATLTGLLSRMEEKGLILRRSENSNRKSIHVYLTPEGKEKQRRVLAAFNELEKRIFEDMPQEEQEKLKESLYKICAKLCDPEVLQ